MVHTQIYTLKAVSIWSPYLKPSFDAIVVGGGYTGLHVALNIKRTRPSWKIAILEQLSEGAAASSRNAGFACFGSPGEILDDLVARPTDEVVETLKKRFLGVEKLGEMSAIESLHRGGYEVFTSAEEERFEKINSTLPYINEVFEEALQIRKLFKIVSISKMNMAFQNEAFFNSYEFQLNPGLLHQYLVNKCVDAGIHFHRQTELLSWDSADGDPELHTNRGKFNTGILALCTNGFTKKILPEIDVEPARAQVLLTTPLTGSIPIGNFHADRGYYYFRNWQGRILLGGGRQLDMDAETTFSDATTEIIQNHLEDYLGTYILPNRAYSIESRWAGTMGFGQGKKPMVINPEKNVYGAFAYGGMGVALAEQTAEELSNLIFDF